MSALEARWSIRLIGAVEARGLGQTITHWPSRAVAALLARLALAPDRAHAREELIELLWPGVDLDIGRNRLRQALSTLKSLLEPPGPQRVVVLTADRYVVRVVPGALHCDARELARRVRAGEPLPPGLCDDGELMPGFYDQWITEERLRLVAMRERVAPPEADAPAAASRAPWGVAASGDPGRAMPLPAYLTRAFGLDAACARLIDTLAGSRLVTLHGPGGSGKTRLAVEAARRLRESVDTGTRGDPMLRFERVLFVPLIGCSTEPQLLEAVARAAGAVGAAGSGDDARHLRALLDGRQVLLVLDNVEQLLPQADAAIHALLEALPHLRVLVTSRRLFGIDGERAFELEGLPLPRADAPFAEIVANPAVALFVDRARAVRADLRLGERQAATLSALVRLLGGMPLAIELAASRVRSLAPSELLERLRDGAGTPMLDLLARPRARASSDARHASMRHMVAWSWRQLRPEQTHLMTRLSVFGAPASAAAVAFVAGLEPAEAGELLDELHDLSLVQRARSEEGRDRDGSGDGPSGCHVLLQPVREFAAERLRDRDAVKARARLRRWLVGRARALASTRPADLAGELAHVHAAIVTAPADGAWCEALELAVALRPVWEADVLPLADVRALESALPHAADPVLEAEAREVLAAARLWAGCGVEALAHAEAALLLPLDARRRSLVLARWASVRYGTGRHDDAIDQALDEALALAAQGGDAAGEAVALRLKALMDCNLRLDFARCEAGMARAQALWERLGNARMAYARLRDRAVMWAWMGRNEDAVSTLRECAAAARADADWHGLIISQRQLGRVLVRLRRWEEAATALRGSLEIAWLRQHLLEVSVALLHLPDALVHLGDPGFAAALQGFAGGQWERLFGPLNRIERRELRRTRLLLHRRLGTALAEARRLEGLCWTLAEAVARALDGRAASDGGSLQAPLPPPAEGLR